jgi:DNA-binding transcriptional LysR family regulator
VQANLQSTRWDDIRIFLSIHRKGTLAAAATQLGLDTSTVSRRLAALEADLGTPLFERRRTGLVPARSAARVLAAAEAMEAAHARVTRDASDPETLAEGIVRISTAPGISSAFIAPALGRLRKLHPRIQIELDAATAPRDLTRREADLAVRSVRSQGAELVTTRLATSGWIAAGSRALAGKLGAIGDWGDAPWIQWDRDFASFGPARWIGAHVPAASIALRTSDFVAQLAAATAGVAVVLAPVPYLERAQLVPLRFAPALARSTDAWPSDDLWLVGHRELREVPRIAAVWHWIVDEFRSAV